MQKKTKEQLAYILVPILLMLLSWTLVQLWEHLIIKDNEEQWEAIRGLLNLHTQ